MKKIKIGSRDKAAVCITHLERAYCASLRRNSTSDA